MEPSWAVRVAATGPEACRAAGAAAPLIARHRCATADELPEPVAVRATVLLAVGHRQHVGGVRRRPTCRRARCVLDHTRSWPADLVVLGRAGHSGPGQPYIGHHTQHVLGFAEWPVLTVPPAGH